MAVESQRIRSQPRPACLLCGAHGETLYDGLRDRLFAAPGEWRLVRCPESGCGLLWLDPAPVNEDLPLFYRHYYTHHERPGRLREIGYRLVACGYQAVNLLPALLVGLLGERRRLRSMFLEDLRPGRLYDVGYGDGLFLHRMKRRGWTGSGIDLDEAVIPSGMARNGLDFARGDFQSAIVAENDFDAVTMSHVIEHLPDPVAVLEKCRDLLRPGGRLVVTTPNALSHGHRKFTRNWRGLEPPRHLQIFSPTTLAECARRVGLVVDQAVSTAASADYIAAASHAIAAAPPEAAGIGGRWVLRSALRGIIFQYREHLELRRDPQAGEECVLICRRPGG